MGWWPKRRGGHNPPKEVRRPTKPPPNPVPPPGRPPLGKPPQRHVVDVVVHPDEELPTSGITEVPTQRTCDQVLQDDGWRMGRDGLWRNDRFGGAYKGRNALMRVGSRHGEIVHPDLADFDRVNGPLLVSIRDITINYAREPRGAVVACVIRHYPTDCEVVAFRDGRKGVSAGTLCDEALKKLNEKVAESGWFEREEK